MIPVEVAKNIAEEHACRQVILFAWDGNETHVVTYGQSVEDCDQAATGANVIKKGWGWPESTLTTPSRVKALEQRIKDLEAALAKATNV